MKKTLIYFVALPVSFWLLAVFYYALILTD